VRIPVSCRGVKSYPLPLRGVRNTPGRITTASWVVGFAILLLAVASWQGALGATPKEQLRDYLAARGIEYVSRANWLPSNAPGHPWPGTDWRSDPETAFHPIRGVSLHCPAPWVVDCNRVGEIRARERAVVEGVWRFHRDERRWPDIGYHYLIFPSGRVYEGRAGGFREKDGRLLSIEGAHTAGYNRGYVGIAFVPTGNPRGPRGECDSCFYREMPAGAALRAATHLIAWMFLRNGVDPMGSQPDVRLHYGRAFTIAGHRDFWIKGTDSNLKDCPGDQFYGGKKVGESHPAPENCTTVLCELRRSVAKEMAAATPIPTIGAYTLPIGAYTLRGGEWQIGVGMGLPLAAPNFRAASVSLAYGISNWFQVGMAMSYAVQPGLPPAYMTYSGHAQLRLPLGGGLDLGIPFGLSFVETRAGIEFGYVRSGAVASMRMGAGLTVHGGAAVGAVMGGWYLHPYAIADFDLLPSLKLVAEFGFVPLSVTIGAWLRVLPFLDVRLAVAPLTAYFTGGLYLRL